MGFRSSTVHLLHHLRALLLWVAVGAVPAQAQERVQLNQVTAVEVRDGEVRIVGTRRPNFTSFTLTQPPRLVVDISEALFKGVPAQQKGSGEITGVRTAAYGSEASAIARVLIGFQREVETDIHVDEGNALVVRVTNPTAGLVAAREAGKAASTAAQEELSRQQEEATAARDRAEAERAELERVKAEQARHAEEVRRLAEEARAAAETEKARKAEEARAAAEAEKARKAEEARAAAEAEKVRKAEEARAAAEEKARQAEEARAAAEAEKVRKAEEARA
ncbi:MAG: AMIN domain-containing protein, partial [Deltaproteobacteria bacterium]|nr:AMIN domain-containing protein [Deltaproteobacteria bacterium]